MTFPTNSGGKQTLTFNGVEFVGYGRACQRSRNSYNDFEGRDVKGKLVVWLPGTPTILDRTAAAAGGRRQPRATTACRRSARRPS